MTFVLRADAGPRSGTGHVMRCYALAQAVLEAGEDVHLVGRIGVEWLRERLKSASIPYAEISGDIPPAESPCALLSHIALAGKRPQDTWVVLDGYHFTPECQLAVMQAGYHLLVIDDYAHLPSYHCDVLLNQNLGAESLVYDGEIGLKLLGPKYALLRKEFENARSNIKAGPASTSPYSVLVTLGGGDFIEGLISIADAMNTPEMAGRKVQIVPGAMDVAKIRQLFAHCPAEVVVLGRVDDMSELLRCTDLCITAGGSTCWELCCLGVPFMTVCLAENQQGVVAGLEHLHVAKPFSKEQMLSMLKGGNANGFNLVDGGGARRVVSCCIQSSVESPIVL